MNNRLILDPTKPRQSELEGLTGPCICVNNFAVLGGGTEFRLHFAEAIADQPREFRCAVSMIPEDFIRFADTIAEVAAKIREQQAALNAAAQLPPPRGN